MLSLSLSLSAVMGLSGHWMGSTAESPGLLQWGKLLQHCGLALKLTFACRTPSGDVSFPTPLWNMENAMVLCNACNTESSYALER